MTHKRQIEQPVSVAIIEPVGGHVGFDRLDFGLARGLAVHGVQVSLYTSEETEVTGPEPFQVKRYFRGIFGNGHKLLRALRFCRGLLHSLMTACFNGEKIVHFHFFHASFQEWLCVAAARFFRRKILISSHDVESFTGTDSNRIARIVYRHADGIIAHNKFIEHELCTKLGISPDRIDVIPLGNFMNDIQDDISTEEARAKLGLMPAAPVLLFFGQIKTVKGLALLLNALPAIVESFPDLVLIIAGKVWKDDFSKYQKIIDSLDLSPNVLCHIRFIPNEEVSTYFKAADLVVLPYEKIYQSAVLLMAMSLGRPVLVSDLEGMTETVKDGYNGFVFRCGDGEHLASRIIEAITDRQKLTRVGIAGRETMSSSYKWEDIGGRIAAIYGILNPSSISRQHQAESIR